MFGLFLCCGHCIYLGLLSIRVCVTCTMFPIDCFFHMYCLIWQLVYLSHFIDTAPHWWRNELIIIWVVVLVSREELQIYILHSVWLISFLVRRGCWMYSEIRTFSKPWNFEKEIIVYRSFKKHNILMLQRESLRTNYI